MRTRRSLAPDLLDRRGTDFPAKGQLMSNRSESIQLADSFEKYMDSVCQLRQSNERVKNSYSELGETWQRLATALHSLSGRDRGENR